jgi:iron complex transport system substrate-binding protein
MFSSIYSFASGNTEKPDKSLSTVNSSLITDLYNIDINNNIVSYTDSNGNRQRVAQEPKRVVICYNSLLDQWYLAGGKAISRVRGTSNVPKEALDIKDLGSMLSLSIEGILSQNPDLVILNAALENQVDLGKMLKSLGIDVLLLDSRIGGYNSFINNIKLFRSILGKEVSSNTLIDEIQKNVNETINKASNQSSNPSVAILFASSSTIYMETKDAQVGEMVEFLKGANIVESATTAASDARIPLNIEYLSQANPDLILISLMGDQDKTKEAVETTLFNNKALKALKAYKENKIYYIPKAYGIYKPNSEYADAFKYIYDKLYESE